MTVDALARRAADELARWRASLPDDERSALDETALEVGLLKGKRLDQRIGDGGRTLHEAVADLTGVDGEALADAKRLSPRERVRRDVVAWATRFLVRRFGKQVVSVVAKYAACDSWLTHPPLIAPAPGVHAPRKRGQRDVSAMTRLVLLVDDGDVLSVGRPLSALEIAMLALVGGHWPARATGRVRRGREHEACERVVAAQVAAARKAVARYGRRREVEWPRHETKIIDGKLVERVTPERIVVFARGPKKKPRRRV